MAADTLLKNMYTFTPNLGAVELPLIFVYHFNCLKSFVLFKCFDPKNNFKNNR